MKKLICFSLFCLFANCIYAQAGWRWQTPYPQGNQLNSIVMNGNLGWAVGAKGTLIHTANGGHDWELIDIGTTETLNCIYMATVAKKGWIVGNNGTIYHTGDGGESWVKQNSGTSEPLYSVSAIEGNCPWVCGNDVILKSYDDGETWNKVSSIFHSRFYSIDHIDCNEIWIAGEDGIVINTTDAGLTWKSHASRTSRDLFSIDVVEYGDYRACGRSGVVVHSTDGGDTWSKENENSNYDLHGIQTKGIIGPAYAVGDDGTILEASGSATSWTKRESPTLYNLKDVAFQGLFDNVYVTGQYGIILRKEPEAGAEFEIMNETTTHQMHAVEFANKNKGWAVGGSILDLQGNSKGIVLQTTNGGDTWTACQNPSKSVNAINVIDENHVWTVGREGLILYTVNGGDSWSVSNSPINGTLTSVSFVDKNNGWVVSMSNWGQIIHTKNGGLSWTAQINPSSNPLYDVLFINENKGWAVGLDSTILVTTNGGQDWKRVITNAANGYRFASVFFIDEMKGWVVGIYGSIMLTEDGGLTWQEINSGTQKTLNSVYFVDHQNGWISGDQGTILRTMDGGHTWIKQYTPVATNFLTSVYFTDVLNGWVSGDGGTIINTKNGGFHRESGTFQSNGLNLPINDLEETSNTIIVDVSEWNKSGSLLSSGGYVLAGLEVFIDTIYHSRVSDLEIYLSHKGITRTLVYRVVDQGANFLWTTLHDEAVAQISNGKAPFSGEYQPEQSFSFFNGYDPNGEWTLTIYDSREGETGELKSWGMRPLFEKATAVSDNNLNHAPGQISLEQNFPNPFSYSTQIKWHSSIKGLTRLEIFNLSGQKVATLKDAQMPAGNYSMEFGTSNLSSGIYFYQLRVENFVQTKKLIIQR